MNFAVLNPGGNDREQRFPDGAGAPDERAHPPVNYHGFAACLSGGFFRKNQSIPADTEAVLLLLRRDLKACRDAQTELRRAGKRVAIAMKEAGTFQVAEQLAKSDRIRLFREICARAEGAIATTPELVPFFTAAGARRVEFIPTPYPVDDPRWDFATPPETRRGIFIGTREFDVPSRQHLAALLAIQRLAESMGELVTVFNVDGWRGRRLLAQLGFAKGSLRVVEGRLPYPHYLRLLAEHRLVWQLDASTVPGQVAGDALLCRVPCLGGNGTTERLAFPDLCGHGRTTEQLLDLAAHLLEHPAEAAAAAGKAHALAMERLSFSVITARVKKWFAEPMR